MGAPTTTGAPPFPHDIPSSPGSPTKSKLYKRTFSHTSIVSVLHDQPRTKPRVAHSENTVVSASGGLVSRRSVSPDVEAATSEAEFWPSRRLDFHSLSTSDIVLGTVEDESAVVLLSPYRTPENLQAALRTPDCTKMLSLGETTGETPEVRTLPLCIAERLFTAIWATATDTDDGGDAESDDDSDDTQSLACLDTPVSGWLDACSTRVRTRSATSRPTSPANTVDHSGVDTPASVSGEEGGHRQLSRYGSFATPEKKARITLKVVLLHSP